MKVVIVESPAKAKTIERFLGSGYKVAACYGHIRDLPSSADEIPEEIRKQPWARMAVDTENDFEPHYIVPNDCKKHVAELKKLVKGADEVLLATDEDREGESISWHLSVVLQLKAPRRITFHEITRPAIQEALATPRDVDLQLVRAQETRRILDRLFGYSLSPVLWKKVRTKLSAGRVQSVALRLIVEREEERQAFHSAEYWDVEATLRSDSLEFVATLVQVGEQRLAVGKDFDPATGRLKESSKALALDRARAEHIAQAAVAALPWTVARIERKETRPRPSPPYTTSTLQQAASANLGMAPRQTMSVAQKLYEGVDLGGGEREGLITYMRTDSLTLSEKALSDCERFVKETFGESYHTGPRRYRTQSKSAQEAHEAIRPTEVSRTPESVAPYLSKEELALYRLIWNRAVASQMADAILDKVTVDLRAGIEGTPHFFRANGSTVRFPGFLKIYESRQKDTLLPEMNEGQVIGAEAGAESVKLRAAKPSQHVTQPPARYTEAGLIKKLEEEGIGRPSTYAPTISTIEQREYALKKSGVLIPTYIGMAVIHLLRRHFPQYVDIRFTARMEESLDDIASGAADWVAFLSKFYHGAGEDGEGLARRIEEELPKIEFPFIPIGQDPETGQPISVRIGQRTVYVQRGEGGEGNTASLPAELLIDELTLDKASALIHASSKSKEPLGQDPETKQNVYALVGPYGPYVQLGETGKGAKPKRVSLPKGKAIEDVDLSYALRLLSLPRVIGADPESGKPITAGIGRYGPYLDRAGDYRNLPSLDEVFAVTLDQALKILSEEKRKKTKEVLRELGGHPETGKPMKVLKGRYGPYVTDGKVNATLPKDADPTAVTLEEAVALLSEAAAKPKKRPVKRRGKA